MAGLTVEFLAIALGKTHGEACHGWVWGVRLALHIKMRCRLQDRAGGFSVQEWILHRGTAPGTRDDLGTKPMDFPQGPCQQSLKLSVLRGC